MAAPAILAAAQAATSLAKQYGPDAVSALKKLTNGQVAKATDIPAYVAKQPERFLAVGQALVSAGVSADRIVSDQLAAQDPILAQFRSSAQAAVAVLRDSQAKNAVAIVPAGPTSFDQTAADVIRIKRVKAALAVHGTRTNYLLLHANVPGSIPEADFVWYEQVGSAMRSI